MGGVMTEEDLASHYTTFPTPIMTNYRGVEVWEIPPNGQGLAALIDGLDLVVSTSNVTAHFAGALAKPCLLALQVTPLWYWGWPPSRSRFTLRWNASGKPTKTSERM